MSIDGTQENHTGLDLAAPFAAVLRRVPRWVASYDLCPEVERLYSWASINPVETVYTTAKTWGAPTRARRREVLVVPRSQVATSGPDLT
ncbi:MAG: hypothetical protein R3F05_01850 [Planctomycetota bacterium]